MAEEKPASRTVRLSNSSTGPRYVHTVNGDGPTLIAPGTTSEELDVLQADLDSLPDGVSEGELQPGAAQAIVTGGAGGRSIDTGGAAEGVDGSDKVDGTGNTGGETAIPDDLASSRSADGIVGLDKLQDVARAEGVEFESDDNKADLLAKIVAKRNSTAA